CSQPDGARSRRGAPETGVLRRHQLAPRQSAKGQLLSDPQGRAVALPCRPGGERRFHVAPPLAARTSPSLFQHRSADAVLDGPADPAARGQRHGLGALLPRARLSHRAAAGLSWLHASLARMLPRSGKEPGAGFRSEYRNYVRGTADRNRSELRCQIASPATDSYREGIAGNLRGEEAPQRRSCAHPAFDLRPATAGAVATHSGPAGLAATGLERRRQRQDRDPRDQAQSRAPSQRQRLKVRLCRSRCGQPSIAVLPFQNMSGDSEQEYFADGIVEDIITVVSDHPMLDRHAVDHRRTRSWSTAISWLSVRAPPGPRWPLCCRRSPRSGSCLSRQAVTRCPARCRTTSRTFSRARFSTATTSGPISLPAWPTEMRRAPFRRRASWAAVRASWA